MIETHRAAGGRWSSLSTHGSLPLKEPKALALGGGGMSAFLDLVGRDLRLALRQIADVTLALAFFLIAAALFPLGVGPEPQTLARIAPGVVWVLALLSVLLSLDRLFQQDYEDGSLDLLLLAPAPLWLTVLAKVLAHWITTGLPLMVLAPVIAVMLNMPDEGLVASCWRAWRSARRS